MRHAGNSTAIRRALAAVAAALAVAPLAAQTPAPAPETVLRNVRVFDARAGAVGAPTAGAR